MISSEKAKEFLKSKAIKNQQEIRLAAVNKLSGNQQRLGLLLINEVEEYKDGDKDYQQRHTDAEKRRKEIQMLMVAEKEGKSIWENGYAEVLPAIFGAFSPCVKKAWDGLNYLMYQISYDRRSFRAPQSPDLYLERKIKWIDYLLPDFSYDLSLPEYAQYLGYLSDYPGHQLTHVLAAAIETNDEIGQAVQQVLINTIYGKDSIGKISRAVIKTLLLTESTDNHVAIEQLLLSAQRQEGLRQSVLECLDETTLSAQKYLMQVVLDHDLLRFSSVVRALDVWCGMGWEAAKAPLLKRCMEMGLNFLNQPETIDAALQSKDNLEIYMALWASGCLGMENTIPRIETVLKRKESEKKATGLLFLSQIKIPHLQTKLALPFLDKKDLLVTTFAFNNIVEVPKEKQSAVFKILIELWQQLGEKNYVVNGKVFSWTHFELTRKLVMDKAFMSATDDDFELLSALFDQMHVDNRGWFARTYLNGEKEITPAIREFIFVALTDRSDWVRSSAFAALEKIKLTAEEAVQAEAMLSRKSADLRKGVLKLLIKQEEKAVLASTKRLLESKKLDQRLGGLDLLHQLFKNKVQLERVQALANAYQERKKLSDKELILLSNINANAEEYTLANGFGLYNPAKLTTSPSPIDRLGKLDSVHPYPVDMEKMATTLDALLQLLEKHKDYEYEYEYWDGTKTKILLGSSSINRIKYKHLTDTIIEGPRDYLEALPLFEVWENWFQESNLTNEELWFFNILARPEWGYSYEKTVDFLKPIKQRLKPKIQHKIYKSDDSNSLWSAIFITDALSQAYPFDKKNETCLNILESLLAAIPEHKLDDSAYKKYGQNIKPTWRENSVVRHWMNYQNQEIENLSKSELSRLWHLHNWYFRTANKELEDWRSSLDLNVAAFQNGIINEDDFTENLLFVPNNFRNLTTLDKKQKSEFQADEKIMELVRKCVGRILDIELKRGDTETVFSTQALRIQSIYGIDRLVAILSAMKKEKLQKGYIYGWASGSSKKESFSHLLRVVYPKKTETFDDFSKAIKATKISEQRLLEVAMYSPQWLPMIQDYLGWKQLTDAVWWFHAHTKESDYQSDARWDADVNMFTKLTASELSDGAVDVQWFRKVYQGLKKARWTKLYDAAKYISTGPGYRRAQIFADAMLNVLKQKEVIEKIKDKRNQDYVRALGLLPLNKRNPEGDILKKYRLLQQFLKESKQFGSQRQVSEKAAVKISMDNLARTAGYPDPIRLSWAMEALEAQEILAKSKPFVEGEVEIVLKIDDQGKTHLITTKAGKTLKAIPAKLRKHKSVLLLKAAQKTLREQYKRTRKALEEAMCRGDKFSISEVDKLLQHPVVAPQLKCLVWAYVADGKTTVGYFENGQLIVPEKEKFTLPDDAMIRLAHCTDLHASGDWSALQKDCFQAKKVQPFKQIFRELYLPTHDELAEVTTSRRYAGHQVQPQKTVALLKTRGWTVDPDSGLRKVYHQENIIVNLFAIADWFTPADVESPTLETVSFTNRNDHKLIPFKDLSPLIFSEVMRDIDLVVSVAHAGGVDPEASHSTIEMRTVMAQETVDLLGFDNVSLKGNHILIKGTLGDYSVHLGSGVVHKLPGGYLSILPVHSAHRGRIFLPFADDDPKTSEILSKVLLLAEDGKIKDPTVLRQI